MFIKTATDNLYIVCGLRVAHYITHTHLFGDVAVLVNVVEVKRPVELLSDRTSEQHWQADDKVLKPDWTVSVNVKCVEQEVSVRGCICGQIESGSQIYCTVFSKSTQQAKKRKWFEWRGGFDCWNIFLTNLLGEKTENRWTWMFPHQPSH